MNKELLTALIGELIKNDKPVDANTTDNQNHSDFWKIGEKYFIRTVTMHSIGELVAFNDKELLLRNACWVADSGRFNNALKNGQLSEVEPFEDDIIVNRSALVDATLWRHDLPRDVI